MILYFEGHQSYYASQPTEMLNASYMHRLKVINAYPYEWKPYHFFNSSSQAIVQGLIQHPGLFTYQIAKTLITIFILLSFGEFIFLNVKFSIQSILIFLFWLTIGFSFFSESLIWNFKTSGAFSVFAIANIVFTFLSKKYSDAIIFSFILGASVFRLMPISLLSIVMLIYLFYKSYLNKEFIKSFIKKNLLYDILLILFLCYNFLTLFSPETMFYYNMRFPHKLEQFVNVNQMKNLIIISDFISNNFTMVYLMFVAIGLFVFTIGVRFIFYTHKYFSSFPVKFKKKLTINLFTVSLFVYVIIATLYNGNIFYSGWLRALAIYKWIGYLSHGIFGETPFNFYNVWLSDFSLIPHGSINSYLLVLLILIMLTLLIFIVKKEKLLINLFTHNPYIYNPLLILVIASLFNKQVFYLNLIAFPYLFLSLLLLYKINTSNWSNNILSGKEIFLYSFAVQLGALLFQFLGSNGITGPVTYVIFDVFLWSIFGIFLFTVKIRRIHVLFCSFILILSISMGLTIEGIFKEHITRPDTIKVDITPLIKTKFNRDLFVDNNNLFIYSLIDPAYKDAYSAILGAYLPYSDESKSFMSYRHILKEK